MIILEQMELQQYMVQFFKSHPTVSIDEIQSIALTAKKQAVLESIPTYEPTNITLKGRITSDFTEQIRKAERKTFIDEATFEDDNYD
jgi:phosphate-selective porin